ncbi:MAG: cytochrome c, partial [Polyangiaceae bacterium]
GTNLTGDPVMGATLYASSTYGCNGCHGDKAQGGGGPNITGNMMAGIGSWTQQQFQDAVRTGKNRMGTPLCNAMVPFPESVVSNQGLADVYAFTKAQNSADVQTGTYCPVLCTAATNKCTGSAM